MIPANLNLSIYRGQTWKKELKFTINHQPIDLTAYNTFKAEIRPQANSETLCAEMTCDLTDGANGILVLSLTSTQTAGLAPGTLVWDMKSLDANEETDYWVCGNVTISGRVTV